MGAARGWREAEGTLGLARAALLPVGAAAAAAAVLGSAAECGWMAAAGAATGGLAALAAVAGAAGRSARRVRREFAQGVSHEMRTGLAHIQVYTEMLLLRRERSEAEGTRWLEVVGREAHRLEDMVENLLAYAHGPDPDAAVLRERTDLGAVLEDVAADFAAVAAARGMRIAASPPAEVFAEVHPRALRRALANLVDNALRHGAPGQTVTLSLERGPEGARLSVADQGPGVPRRDRSRVWEPFEHGGPTGGMGLGLPVVRSFAALHGGRVFVDDAPGGGARFGIVLPTAGAALPAPALAAAG